MKTYNIQLNDGRTVQVQADHYQHEGKQYTFCGNGNTEVQFFADKDVSAIYEAMPPVFIPVPKKRRSLIG